MKKMGILFGETEEKAYLCSGVLRTKNENKHTKYNTIRIEVK